MTNDVQPMPIPPLDSEKPSQAINEFFNYVTGCVVLFQPQFKPLLSQLTNASRPSGGSGFARPLEPRP